MYESLKNCYILVFVFFLIYNWNLPYRWLISENKGRISTIITQSTGTRGVYYRRYACVFCAKCQSLDFLNCTNEYCGPWKFKPFEIKSSNLVDLLEPIFGATAQLPNKKSKAKAVQNKRKKMSKQITKLICSYYRAIIDSWSVFYLFV